MSVLQISADAGYKNKSTFPGLFPAQARLCDPWTSGDLGWNAAGGSQHQLHQQPVLWLHHHQTGWKVTANVFIFMCTVKGFTVNSQYFIGYCKFFILQLTVKLLDI